MLVPSGAVEEVCWVNGGRRSRPLYEREHFFGCSRVIDVLRPPLSRTLDEAPPGLRQYIKTPDNRLAFRPISSI